MWELKNDLSCLLKTGLVILSIPMLHPTHFPEASDYWRWLLATKSIRPKCALGVVIGTIPYPGCCGSPGHGYSSFHETHGLKLYLIPPRTFRLFGIPRGSVLSKPRQRKLQKRALLVLVPKTPYLELLWKAAAFSPFPPDFFEKQISISVPEKKSAAPRRPKKRH